MSCEVLGDEIQFRFGSNAAGLSLYFDWDGLLRFIQLSRTMTRQVEAIPDGEPIRFVVSADEQSRREHTPNCG
jgi:hypothetical protein